MLSCTSAFLLLTFTATTMTQDSYSRCTVPGISITVYFSQNYPRTVTVPVKYRRGCVHQGKVVITKSEYVIDNFVFNRLIPATITSLNLSWNQIRRVPNGTLNNNIEELVLAHNFIWNIEALSTYQKLKRADLSYNRITAIPNLSLAQLSYLDLTGNQITTINTGSFGLVPSLRHLNISSNPVNHIAMCRFNDWIHLNLTETPALAKESILCKQCWCHWSFISKRCPTSKVCDDDKDDFAFDLTTKSPKFEDRFATEETSVEEEVCSRKSFLPIPVGILIIVVLSAILVGLLVVDYRLFCSKAQREDTSQPLFMEL